MFAKSSLSFTILKLKKGIGRIQTSFLGLKTRHYPSPWLYCQIRYIVLHARFANFEGILGFSHLSGGGVNVNHNGDNFIIWCPI